MTCPSINEMRQKIIKLNCLNVMCFKMIEYFKVAYIHHCVGCDACLVCVIWRRKTNQTIDNFSIINIIRFKCWNTCNLSPFFLILFVYLEINLFALINTNEYIWFSKPIHRLLRWYNLSTELLAEHPCIFQHAIIQWCCYSHILLLYMGNEAERRRWILTTAPYKR